MFFHKFKYSLLYLLRNKALIFWTFAFPIVLATFFKMAFSNIEKEETLNVSNIAIVNNDDFNNNEIYKETFSSLSRDNNDKLFDIKYTNENEALNLLNSGDIIGYLILDGNEPQVVIKSNGIYQTILTSVVEEIEVNTSLVNTYVNESLKKYQSIDISEIKEKVNEIMNTETNVNDISGKKMSYTMIEYYTVIALACLYGGLLSVAAINKEQANIDNVGKRNNVSPVKKSKLVFASLCASFVTELIGVSLLLLYTIFVLKVDYGSTIPYLILSTIVGSLSGLSLGLFVGCLKVKDGVKTGIMIAISMICCFFSGMMGITMKYIMDTYVPVSSYINPAAMLTDSFYCLYYYGGGMRYFTDILLMFLFSLVMILLSINTMRRVKYDSI